MDGGGVEFAEPVQHTATGYIVTGEDLRLSTAIEQGLKLQIDKGNPIMTAGNLHRLEGRQIVMATLSDLAKSRQLGEVVRRFIENQGHGRDFLDNFEEIISNLEQFKAEIFRTKAQAVEISTRNTVSRLMTASTISKDGAVQRWGIGVEYDVHALLTEMGVRILDEMIRAAMADLTGALVLAAVRSILAAHSRFTRAATFMKTPGDIDLDVAFSNMAFFHGIFEKSEHAATDLLSHAASIYGRRAITEILMSRESGILLSMQQDAMINFSKTGAGALRVQKAGINTLKSISGVKISALPFIEPDPINKTDNQYLLTPARVVQILPFYNDAFNMPPNRFKEYQTSIQVVDFGLDHWVTFRLRDALRNLPWFYDADDAAKEKSIKAGSLDVSTLDRIASDASREMHFYINNLGPSGTVDQQPFAISGTLPVGNEESMPLLRLLESKHATEYYKKSGAGTKAPEGYQYVFVPVRLVGELSEKTVMTDHLLHIAEQLHTLLKKKFDGRADKIDDMFRMCFGSKEAANKLIEMARVPEYNGTESDSVFQKRETRSNQITDDGLKACFRRLLATELDVEVFGRFLRHNVNCPIGVCMFRVTRRYMRSMIALSKSSNGKIGTVVTPGLSVESTEIKATQSGELQQGKLTFAKQAGFKVMDVEATCPFVCVQGAHVVSGCGGFGSGFFPQRQRLSGKPLHGNEILNIIERGQSNFVFITSTNAMINKTFPKTVPITGYNLPEFYLGFADSSRHFNMKQTTSLYEGQQMFMWMNKFFYRPPQSIDRERVDFFMLAQERANSVLAGMGSVRHFSHVQGVDVTAARNLDGPIFPGSKHRLQGYAIVGNGITIQERAGKNRNGVYMGAGGVEGGKRLKLGFN